MFNNALSTVLKLDGKNYEYKNKEFSIMNLADGLQYGFIAQDVEKVLPDLIDVVDQKLTSINEKGIEKKEGNLNYKGVNYIDFIPLLTEAIKEQQGIIEKQNAEFQEFKERILAIESFSSKKMQTSTSTGAALMQNVPNPFQSVTNIRYELPKGIQDARMIINDLQGRQVKDFRIDDSGLLVIEAGELEARMYLYSLIVEGKIVKTLKMLITNN